MCGIAGIFNYLTKTVPDIHLLDSMVTAISHRGPDENGTLLIEDGGVGLGHARLSIVDLVGGKQPMSNEDGSIWVVFNGEIYNHILLRKELQSKGHIFKTQSDTEAIVHLYEQYGIQDFSKLNGIFAFSVFDNKKKCLILVRDHFGVKPLYYYLDKTKLLFSSEIKSILKDKSIERILDIDEMGNFLTYRFSPSPNTLFKGIKKLEPGHYIKISFDGTIENSSFWNYEPKTNTAIKFNDAVDHYQFLLEESVKKQMMSDVPLGVFLSGGIDSAIIAFLMQKYASDRIKSFTIGFPGVGNFNELHDAKKTSNFVGTDHHEILISKDDYVNYFRNSFYHIEEPIADMAIPSMYFVSNLASQHVKVVLSGQGADEPLAGYKRYIGEKLINQVQSLIGTKLPLYKIALYIGNESIRRTFYAMKYQNDADRFSAIYSIFNEYEKQLLIKNKIYGSIKSDPVASVKKLLGQCKNIKDTLGKMLFVDTRTLLSDDLLLWGDKMTMANSIEMRVPFLDIELISFLETLPSSFKLRYLTNKYLHKIALKKWLPDEIINRKKLGFQTPIEDWLKNDSFYNEVKDTLFQPNSATTLYFNKRAIDKILADHYNGRSQRQRQIFTLYTFELWYQNFFLKFR